VGINLVLRSSYQSNQSATVAFWIFMGFYILAGVITYVFYVRRPMVITETTDLQVTADKTAAADTPDGPGPADKAMA
jgi:NNP family nitrate/nitrite transporter-like MFS transporter